MKIDKSQLTAALAAAIRDISENGVATPNNPAILMDGHSGRISYGSSLTNIYPEDRILLDLQEGVGAYECNASDDIHAVASKWVDDIIENFQREIDEATGEAWPTPASSELKLRRTMSACGPVLRGYLGDFRIEAALDGKWVHVIDEDGDAASFENTDTGWTEGGDVRVLGKLSDSDLSSILSALEEAAK
jgi:hypothetical protein